MKTLKEFDEDVLRLKAFIYRFSAIFGVRIYLADKEERLFNLKMEDSNRCAIGLWQARYGFLTRWTYKMPFYKAFIANVQNAFTFNKYDL
jgi:hypothetical protein